MPSSLVRMFLAIACALTAGLVTPVYAGWGREFLRSVVPPLIKRAAVSMIEAELYDVEEPQESEGQAPPVYDTSVRYRYSPSHKGSHRWQSSQNEVDPLADFQNPPPQTGSNKALSPSSSAGSSNPETSASLAVRNKLESTAVDSYAADAFDHAAAGKYSWEQMVKAKLFTYCPMRGGVFPRHDSVKYIILHSTETGSLADAQRVIHSWSNRGAHHPGAQFVVDRDGTIYSTTNPDLATVHINVHKTLPGYSNDNSIGIEIVRAGKQQYTRTQLDSVMYLVSYLQDHYHVADCNITTHHHVQPSDRRDPVGFDLIAFESSKSSFRQDAIAWTANHQPEERTDTHSQTSSRDSTLIHNSSLSKALASANTHPRHLHRLAQMPKPAPNFRLLRYQPE